jgi:hypothetical protein
MPLIPVVVENRLKFSMNIILWTLVVFGFTSIVTISKVFEPVRNWFFKGYKWIPDQLGEGRGTWELDGSRPKSLIKVYWKIGELLKCSMCTGFWAGMLFSWWWFSPTAIVGGNLFFDAILGSVVCWMLYSFMWAVALKHQGS